MFKVYAQKRYDQIEPIGTGEGMNSSVFRAYDPYLKREFAVKEVRKDKFGNDFDAYCQEARTMFAASDAHVVGIEYVCETPDHVAFALPYFSRGSLQRRIKNKPLGLLELLKVAQGILAGVSRIHSAGLLHLDLKPSNILFDDADKPLVADFGQSREVTSDGTVRFPGMYKWAMPPEVWETNIATVQSDIYQLGVLLYRSANGDSVYDLQKSAILSNSELQRLIKKGRFPDGKFFLPHVPKRIRTIIRKAVRIEPTQRYHSASELAATLGRVVPTLNWCASAQGGGAYSWRAIRPGRPDFEVELCVNGTSGWQTRVWTNKDGDRRKKGVSEYWKEQFDYAAACDHLTEVFADLGQ
jgi:eukaryotic-like serine/threonine-protein kinase